MKRGDYLRLLQRFTGRFIIGGDFISNNTYWGSRLTTTKGTELYQAIREDHCEVHTTEKPTYWPTDPNKVPYLFEFFVSKYLSSSFTDVTEEFDLDSDHSPIVLTLSDTIIKKGRNPTLSNNHTDWDLFRETLASRINLRVALTTTHELEEVQKFVTGIQHSAWKACYLQKSIKGNKYPEEIRDKIAQKRKIRKSWQMTQDPRIKTELNPITQELRRTVLEIKQQVHRRLPAGINR